MIFILITLACVLLTEASVVNPDYEKNINRTDIQLRLDGSIIPIHYRLTITPYLFENEVPNKERFTYDGDVEIIFSPAVDGVDQIVLFAEQLQLNETLLGQEDGSLTEVGSVELDNNTTRLIVKLNQTLEKGSNYVLVIKYFGRMRDDMKGFYKSYYTDRFGNKRWVALTQFQPFYARRAFPCFDEPKYKATFEIKINRNRHFYAHSNSKVLESMPIENDRILDTFKITPRMSTYLVAFLITDFAERIDKHKNFSILARMDAYYDTEYSFKIGKKILNELNNYIGIPYNTLGIPKLDLAAIPDFHSGAMENWGLITNREIVILYNPNSTNKYFEESLALTIAHEMAHMWFGNLVTCEWWSYSWLNEGFASYLQYFIPHQMHRDWELDKQFVIDQVHTALDFDTSEMTFPLSNPAVESAVDTEEMFAMFTYSKGASIIRMVKHILGEDNFKSAIQSYLDKYKYGTVVPDNLFDELRNQWDNTQVDITRIMKDFTEQIGYPVVIVKLSPDGTRMVVSQKRFFLDYNEDAGGNLLYTIPFTYVTDKNLDFSKTRPNIFLKKTTDELTIVLPEKAEFVIANIQQVGYYRVAYDEANWDNIRKFLNGSSFKKIHEINRAQIVDDLFHLTRAGIVKYNLLFKMLEYLKQEDSYLPWLSAFNGFFNIAIRLGVNNSRIFGEYIVDITSEIYKKLSFEEKPNERRLDTYNRVRVLAWSCRYGNKDCMEKSKALFKKLIDDNVQVPLDIRLPIYCTALQYGSDKEFDYFWSRYKNESSASEKAIILTAMGCTKSDVIVEKYLNLILSKDVRSQDKSHAIATLFIENPENVQLILDFVINNYRKIASTYAGIAEIIELIAAVISRITDEVQFKTMQDFYMKTKDEFGDYSEIVKHTLDNVHSELKWYSVHIPEILDYLKKRNPDTAYLTLSHFLIIGVVSLFLFIFLSILFAYIALRILRIRLRGF